MELALLEYRSPNFFQVLHEQREALRAFSLFQQPAVRLHLLCAPCRQRAPYGATVIQKRLQRGKVHV